jgi:hypothetical protein
MLWLQYCKQGASRVAFAAREDQLAQFRVPSAHSAKVCAQPVLYANDPINIEIEMHRVVHASLPGLRSWPHCVVYH